MKSFAILSLVSFGLSTAAAVGPIESRALSWPPSGSDGILTCIANYADGGIYQDSLSSATEQFHLLFATWGGGWDSPYSLVLLTREVGSAYPYQIERRLLQPYVDVSPGAFAPVRFVADNSTLKGGETTYGWRSIERITYFDVNGNWYGSGFQWVPVEGGRQLYWNQTRYESDIKSDVKAGEVLVCYSLTSSVVVDKLDETLAAE